MRLQERGGRMEGEGSVRMEERGREVWRESEGLEWEGEKEGL